LNLLQDGYGLPGPLLLPCWMSELLAILQGPETVMDQLAGAGVTALLDLALD
jgi:hypothetical protein